MLEKEELERFVGEYGDHAYNFAYSLCRNEPEADELVQSAFVKVLSRAERFDAEQPLEGWFNTVLKRLYLDRRRSWEYRTRLPLDGEVGESGLTLADVVADARDEAPLERLERREKAARVRKALAALPREYRDVLRRVDLEGMGYAAAAASLGSTADSVRGRLSRARRALRGKLRAMAEET